MKPLAAILVLLCIAGSTAWAVTCEQVSFGDVPFTVCEVDLTTEQISLFLRNEDGDIYGQFSSIDTALAARGEQLVFAMNAGMYHEDRSPVGHYVENGREFQRVISNAGPGNFGLLPNGVLCLRDRRADVIETLKYIDAKPNCTHATQSGPMLVIDGELHPRFLQDGTSRYIRNGVGTSTDGRTAFFAISDLPVNFHTFGLFFRDYLGVQNALYFDGKVSRLYAPQVERNDFGFALGPIIGVVAAVE